MQFATLSVILSVASAVAAKTVFVTQLQHVTVYANGEPQATSQPVANVQTVTIDGANNSGAPTTLVTKSAAPSSQETQSAETASPTTTVAAQAKGVQAQSSSEAPSSSTDSPSPASSSASSSSSSSSSSGSDSGIYSEISESDVDADFAKSILDAHNKDRAQHSAPDLSWSKDVYNYAKAYADKYDCSGNLVHSGGKYGENLAYGSGSLSGPSAVQMWYDEGKNYDYSAADTYDHFTQVVWKSTTKVGCAQNTCGGKGTYVICSYDPAGNFIGNSKANVLPN